MAEARDLIGLDAEGQVNTLLAFAWFLTIAAREAYRPGTAEVADPRKLRSSNEIMHLLLQHVQALLEDRSDRYPEQVLVRAIFEQAEQANLTDGVEWAWRKAFEPAKAAER